MTSGADDPPIPTVILIRGPNQIARAISIAIVQIHGKASNWRYLPIRTTAQQKKNLMRLMRHTNEGQPQFPCLPIAVDILSEATCTIECAYQLAMEFSSAAFPSLRSTASLAQRSIVRYLAGTLAGPASVISTYVRLP
jgi:hypothetical protein